MGGERSTASPPVMDYTLRVRRRWCSAGTWPSPRSPAAIRPGWCSCHGFPTRGRESPQSGMSFPELADRIAAELGWLVLTMNFRGCGKAEGDFSLVGWLDDVAAAVRPRGGARRRWCVARRVRLRRVRWPWSRGPATPRSGAWPPWPRRRDFDDWAKHPRRLLLHARQVQVIKDPDFPVDFDALVRRSCKAVRPLEAAARFAPRPLLVLHGDTRRPAPRWRTAGPSPRPTARPRCGCSAVPATSCATTPGRLPSCSAGCSRQRIASGDRGGEPWARGASPQGADPGPPSGRDHERGARHGRLLAHTHHR